MNQQGQVIHSNYEPNVDNLMKYIKGASAIPDKRQQAWIDNM